MRIIISILLCFMLTACNSVYYKPHTLDKSQTVYASRGGYSMQRSIKQTMEERGYNVRVGTLKTEYLGEDSDFQTFDIPRKTKYVVAVKERKEILRPIWCMFNGFWWWNFNVSIIDRTNNNEILSWRGRGCVNSSIRKMNDIFDKLENTSPAKKQKINIHDKDSEIIEQIIITTESGIEQ